MATAPAKKQMPASNPLDDLDDGLEALPASAGATSTSDPLGASLSAPAEEPAAAPLDPPPRALRLLLRGLCGLFIVAAVAVYFLNPSAPMTAAQFDPATTAVVSLVQGPSYGQALVHAGDGAVGDPILDDESLKQALASALAGKKRLLIKASGGVHQREVDRVGRIVLEATDRAIEIHVAPLESPP